MLGAIMLLGFIFHISVLRTMDHLMWTVLLRWSSHYCVYG
jgi:hypothetical protein